MADGEDGLFMQKLRNDEAEAEGREKPYPNYDRDIWTSRIHPEDRMGDIKPAKDLKEMRNMTAEEVQAEGIYHVDEPVPEPGFAPRTLFDRGMGGRCII